MPDCAQMTYKAQHTLSQVYKRNTFRIFEYVCAFLMCNLQTHLDMP